MAETIFQVTQFGKGFHGPGQPSLEKALEILRKKLGKLIGPYQFRGGPKRTFELDKVLAEVKRRAPGLAVKERLIIFGQDTGQHAIALRKTEREEAESPLITFAKSFVGKAPYRLGAGGPPGECDCSGLVMKSVKEVFDLELPRTADNQMRDTHIWRFQDESRLRSGDFVFLNYGRLSEERADHVEFYVQPGQTLGSRGSTDGVGFYDFDESDAGCVLRYGRVKKEFRST